MGYTIKIGNAAPVFSKEDEELHAAWKVSIETMTTAPAFPGDDQVMLRRMKQKNYADYSYSSWANFTKLVGLYELFMNEEDGLMREHSGCFILKEYHYLQIKAALEKRKEISKLPPGFDECDLWEKKEEGSPKYDHVLAQLMWLEWWVRWALDNCETPAIENS